MDVSFTPRAKFPRKKFISPSAGAPYQSPLMHNLSVPEKRVQSSFENASVEVKMTPKALGEKNDADKEKIHQVQQKFDSPLATTSPYQSLFAAGEENIEENNLSVDELKSSLMELDEKNKVLKEKICNLEQKGLKEDMKGYIDKLHRYNEIKDVAQTVMERLAILEEKTIKEVHEDFGMTEND